MEAREARQAEELPDIDDHLVREGSRAEIVEGELVMTPPAEGPHADRHAAVTYVLLAHARPGYQVGVDALVRASRTSDFAPDVSVYAFDPETGKRLLPEISVEVVSEQALSVPTRKARVLAKRGVRRLLFVDVERMQVSEWDRARDGWRLLAADATLDDACLARALPIAALLDAARADDAVVDALDARGTPALRRIEARGRRDGLREGRREGLLAGVIDLCEALDIALDDDRRAALSAMDAEELGAHASTIKRARAWPG